MVKVPSESLSTDSLYYQEKSSHSQQQLGEESVQHSESIEIQTDNLQKDIQEKKNRLLQMAAEPPGVSAPDTILNQSITPSSSNIITTTSTSTALLPPVIAVVAPTSRNPTQQHAINNVAINKPITSHHSTTPSTSVQQQTTSAGQQTRNITEIPILHHHINTMPTSSTTWPLVEPVFHFGPGFEPQPNYCPTHSPQQGGPQQSKHIVLFHVNPGVSVAFQLAEGNREIMRGEFYFHYLKF